MTPGATSNIDPSANRLGYSATPSISWDGTHTNTGIVWLVVNNAPGNDQPGNPNAILYAFRADTLVELYDSSQNSGDQIGVGTAFAIPTVANGLVMVGTRTDFNVFGCKTVNCQ